MKTLKCNSQLTVWHPANRFTSNWMVKQSDVLKLKWCSILLFTRSHVKHGLHGHCPAKHYYILLKHFQTSFNYVLLWSFGIVDFLSPLVVHRNTCYAIASSMSTVEVKQIKANKTWTRSVLISINGIERKTMRSVCGQRFAIWT